MIALALFLTAACIAIVLGSVAIGRVVWVTARREYHSNSSAGVKALNIVSDFFLIVSLILVSAASVSGAVLTWQLV